MKTHAAKDRLVQRADRVAVFAEGVCTGLVVAYIVSAFSHPLPDVLLYCAFGGMIVAAWIPVIARRRRVQEEVR